ncbi:unnamed protein product [Blepharisma stoltei]|uniref:RING-CH-type domain-containing protein n=1 Tax=Blepharisma stoltei TaxID=1481888 RepID=A0AAU9KDQ1_9CILI|nr:unnamed protein product [Blepharisma stoltei]
MNVREGENSLDNENCFSLGSKPNHKGNSIVPMNTEKAESEISEKPKHEPEERTCRICLEPEAPENKLISPCKCAGSVKYVHEECLKTWLASLDEDIENGKCELCSTKFLMDYKIKWRFLPKDACKEGVAQILFVPLLFAVIIMLCLILFLLCSKYLLEAQGEEQGYIIALILTCVFSILVLSILVVNAMKKLCFVIHLDEWHIHDQVFQPEEQQVKVEQTIERTMSVPPVLVIPKSIKLKGKRVRTPSLRPAMTPVNRGSRVVGFTPRYMTPGVSMMSASQSILTPMHTDPCTFRDTKARQNNSKLPFLDESFFE